MIGLIIALPRILSEDKRFMFSHKYGVVYTPNSLSDFVTTLLCRVSEKEHTEIKTVLDPSSGECSLLKSLKIKLGNNIQYIGIDVDKSVVNKTKSEFIIFHNDTIMPKNVKKKTADYWLNKLPRIDAIVANPPWSSEKIYNQENLKRAGYTLAYGQYDSYVLFIELSFHLLRKDGLMAFILPDSLFDSQNKDLRQFLAQNFQIKVIARLGEKIFSEVNRATTVIVCKKTKPLIEDETICFRLSTNDRRAFLAGEYPLISFFEKNNHAVKQSRFSKNDGFIFDVDAKSEEEALLNKIKLKSIDWGSTFSFGRGVEISKKGKVLYCPKCNIAQGYKRKQLEIGKKVCVNCGTEINFNKSDVSELIKHEFDVDSAVIYVGENIQRYCIVGSYYIKKDVKGINYKQSYLYTPPKLLIRKTGLGIYCAIDYTGGMTSQTVYILKSADVLNEVPLEYYLALINSRVVYYYYLKTYGENEWKSHPYLTKQIIFSLPIRPYEASLIDQEIVRLSSELARRYNHETDIELEKLIMSKYDLNKEEKELIIKEMNKLPNLSAINNMKWGG